MKITLPAVVVRVNIETLEALVRFTTGETKVVEVDERFNADSIFQMMDGASVQVEFDINDEFLNGKIVYVNTGTLQL